MITLRPDQLTSEIHLYNHFSPHLVPSIDRYLWFGVISLSLYIYIYIYIYLYIYLYISLFFYKSRHPNKTYSQYSNINEVVLYLDLNYLYILYFWDIIDFVASDVYHLFYSNISYFIQIYVRLVSDCMPWVFMSRLKFLCLGFLFCLCFR